MSNFYFEPNQKLVSLVAKELVEEKKESLVEFYLRNAFENAYELYLNDCRWIIDRSYEFKTVFGDEWDGFINHVKQIAEDTQEEDRFPELFGLGPEEFFE